MNIYHLKYFIDAARRQSISKSAEENHVSHSAVSQAVKGLESFLDVKLLVHSKRRFQLTTEGERLLIEGQSLLSSLAATKESLRSNQKEVSGQLVIWAPQSLIVSSLYEALSVYRKKYPKVQIFLKTGSAMQVRKAITGEEGHIGLLLDDGYLSTFQSSQIKSGEFILVSRTKGEDLKNAELIVTAREKIEVLHLKKKYKSKFKVEMKIAMEVMSWGVIKNLVLRKLGVGYVPDYCVAEELESGKLHRLNSPGLTFQYNIKAIWYQQKQLHPNAKLFLDLLKL